MEVGGYTPEQPVRFEAMMIMFGQTQSPEELKIAMKLYLFDLDYPRADLLMAEKLTKRAKGWR